MRSLSFLSAWVSFTIQLSLPGLVSSAPSNPHVVEDLLIKRQASSPFPVTGVQTGEILPRFEIRDLQKNHPDQFNVYLLGLRSMQSMDQTDFLSYFSIAGIHGVPRKDWNGVVGMPGNNNPGYCTHTSNLFLPWHRPYLALYEQLLVSHAQSAANEFAPGPTRDKYLTAAATLRLPYWDWAATPPSGENCTPDALIQDTIQIETANGTQTVDNPLYSYKFHPIDPGLYYIPYTHWERTLRWPTSIDDSAQTQSQTLIFQMNANNQQVKQRVYNLLTGMKNFSQIGNPVARSGNGPGTYDSLESIHDQIHGAVGGSNYGDMTVIAVSAFDPSFWLHHTMIDRLWTLWQTLWPDSYVQPMVQPQSSYWYNSGSTQDADSPLKPFYSDPRGDFWTANTVRDHTTFGYTYQEIQSNDAGAVRTAINNLYGPSSGPLAFRKHRRRGLPSERRLYQINVQAPKHFLDSSYFIDFFYGNPSSEDPSSWPSDPNLIGTHTVMSMKMPSMPVITTTGVVPLNSHLNNFVEQGFLSDLNEDTVIPFLRDSITWRIRQSNNEELPITSLPGLGVSVASVGVELGQSESDFPSYVGKWLSYPGVTDGKPGGLHFDNSTILKV